MDLQGTGQAPGHEGGLGNDVPGVHDRDVVTWQRLLAYGWIPSSTLSPLARS